MTMAITMITDSHLILPAGVGICRWLVVGMADKNVYLTLPAGGGICRWLVMGAADRNVYLTLPAGN